MKLVTYLKDGHEQLAVLIEGKLYDTDALHPDLAYQYVNVFKLLG